MPEKLDSLLEILSRLNSGQQVSTSDMMESFNVCSRTIRRYIHSLCNAGFPIVFVDGAYRFAEGYQLHKASLSDDEMLSLALARTALKPSNTRLAKSIDQLKDRITGNDLSAYTQLSTNNPVIKNGHEWFRTLHDAIRTRTPLVINYTSSGNNLSSTRTIEPLYLFCSSEAWYLRAWCRTDEANRTFAVDCITAITRMPDSRFYSPPVDAERELSDGFGTYLDGKPTKITIRFGQEVAPRFKRRKWHKSQEIQAGENGSIMVTFCVNGTEGVKRWLYQWLPHAEVLEPPELRAQVAKELRQAAKRHGRLKECNP
jgi:proteasome accessory factor B